MSDPGSADWFIARKKLFKKIEESRKSKLILYATSDRANSSTQIAEDVLDIFVEHLDSIGVVERISLVLYTRGGNTLAAWSLINLLRMFCDDLEVIVPFKAHSAGTLMALGANSIVMTKQATLGPIDPSLVGPLNPPNPGAGPAYQPTPISAEDVRSYLDLARKETGGKASAASVPLLVNLADKLHPTLLGSIHRSQQQIQALADRLLVNQVKDAAKKRKIIDFLCSESGSHDYTLNRREAAALGLKVEKASPQLYELLRALYGSIRDEMKLREPFAPDVLVGAVAQGNSVAFKNVRGLVESRSGGADIYSTEGVIEKILVQANPGVPPAERARTKVLFDGWRRRS